MKPFAATHRPLEHTADLGIEVEAPDRESLFAEAAIALCDTVTPVAGVGAAVERRLEVEAADDELLLVDFLSELLFLFETEGLLFSRARISLDDSREAGGVKLRAVLGGEGYDESKHPQRSLVKAITYHDLRVWQENERFRARVLFDL